MFFVYFITDFVMGYIETFLLFKMFEQRLKVKIFSIHICDLTLLAMTTKSMERKPVFITSQHSSYGIVTVNLFKQAL